MMSLSFLVDHCVPRSVIKSIVSSGYEVFRLQDHLRPDSPDPYVIAKAQELNSILISFNGDFADIVNYPPKQY